MTQVSPNASNAGPPGTNRRYGRLRSNPTQQGVEDLLEYYAATKDPDTCGVLIAHYKGIALSLAHRMTKSRSEREDVEQVAMLGLLKALNRYDPGREASFVTFAWKTVQGEIKRHFRDRVAAVHVPRSLQERGAEVSNAIDDLGHELGRAPTAAEIASRVGVTESDVLEALEMQRSSKPTSLDAPIDNDSGAASTQSIGDEDPRFGQSEDRDLVQRLLNALPERERNIFVMRFYAEMSQSDIAKEIGLSQMHVSRLLAKSMQHLRTLMAQQI